ncbi:hypothetical protein GCM10010912_58620 [Paenibacillus albidus]|uniref:Uncharacterized protein n=1 Tax=Paenibacillus albidus TaxID=2041023 RepID=A0A917D1D9_9BACL|nr:hypothetical protein [Paenibacillus albidus]GGG06289.1 hypothetical protein GCM10010912_58620 [Paenibacillus albidus]
MIDTMANYQLAIQNTKEAIKRAQAAGNTHEADFLTHRTLPRLEKLLGETRMLQD